MVLQHKMLHVRYRFFYLLIYLLSFSVLSSEKQVEVTNYLAKLYLAPSTNSKFLGLAQKGERYDILLVSNYWYRIDYNGSSAWIESSNIQVLNSETKPISNKSISQPTDTATTATESTNITNDSVIEKSPVNSSVQTSPEADSKRPTPSKSTINNKKIASTKVRDSISQNSKFKRWILRQSLTKLPLIEQNDERELKDKFFLVTSTPAKILLILSPDSPILGMAKRGDHLILIGEGESWCKVAYKDTVGWIEKKSGKVVENTSFPFLLYFGAAIIIALILAIIFLIIILLKIYRKKSIPKHRIIYKKKVLIVAKESKFVSSALTDTNNSIESCFLEINFEVKTTSELHTFRSTIDQYVPDVIVIDWRFDRTVISTLEGILNSTSRADSTIVIVYNVPDPSSMQPSTVLTKMVFLGYSFSDRDLLKIVTPLMQSDENAQSLSKATQFCALEGEMADGNIQEVLQYIEVGKKTGCLLIETGKPFCLIFFNAGRIIYAATSSDLTGKDALFSVLNLREGKFSFLLNKKPKSPNTNLSTIEVLMSWTKEIDETTKSRLRSS